MPTMPGGNFVPQQVLNGQAGNLRSVAPAAMANQPTPQEAQLDPTAASGPGQGGAATPEGIQAVQQQVPQAPPAPPAQAQPQAAPQPAQGPAPPQVSPQAPPAAPQGWQPGIQGELLYPTGSGPVSGQVPNMAEMAPDGSPGVPTAMKLAMVSMHPTGRYVAPQRLPEPFLRLPGVIAGRLKAAKMAYIAPKCEDGEVSQRRPPKHAGVRAATHGTLGHVTTLHAKVASLVQDNSKPQRSAVGESGLKAKEKPWVLQGEDAWPDASHYHGGRSDSLLKPKRRGQTESKIAEEQRGPAGEYCPHCDARMERGDNGNCNRCGKPWPMKQADVSQSNDQQISTQMYMPIQPKRPLTDEEHRQIAKGRRQWLPQIFQSYATPVPMMMASPWRQGLLAGLGGGTAGALLGGHLGGQMGRPDVGALIGGVGVGGISALVAGLKRNANNEGLVELMKRMPPNAVKRDLMSDPAVQQDEWRNTFNNMGDQFSDTLQTMAKFSSDKSIGFNSKSADLMDNMLQYGDAMNPSDEEDEEELELPGVKLSHFAQGFLRECLKRGLPGKQIVKQAQVASKLSRSVANELEPLTKEALIGGLLAGASKAMRAARPFITSPVGPRAASTMGQVGQMGKSMLNSPAGKLTRPALGYAAGNVGGQAGGAALGGAADLAHGAWTGNYDTNYAQQGREIGGALGSFGGMFAGARGTPLQRPIGGFATGSAIGAGADMTAQALGHQDTNFTQLGGMAGAGIGAGQGIMGAMRGRGAAGAAGAASRALVPMRQAGAGGAQAAGQAAQAGSGRMGRAMGAAAVGAPIAGAGAMLASASGANQAVSQIADFGGIPKVDANGRELPAAARLDLLAQKANDARTLQDTFIKVAPQVSELTGKQYVNQDGSINMEAAQSIPQDLMNAKQSMGLGGAFDGIMNWWGGLQPMQQMLVGAALLAMIGGVASGHGGAGMGAGLVLGGLGAFGHKIPGLEGIFGGQRQGTPEQLPEDPGAIYQGLGEGGDTIPQMEQSLGVQPGGLPPLPYTNDGQTWINPQTQQPLPAPQPEPYSPHGMNWAKTSAVPIKKPGRSLLPARIPNPTPSKPVPGFTAVAYAPSATSPNMIGD